jgi:hypothetical protein
MHKLFLTLALLLTFVLAANAEMKKISGTASCGKPDPSYSIGVDDPGKHTMMLDKAPCTYTKPMEIEGEQTKDGYSVASANSAGTTAHTSGIHVDTMSNGDKMAVHFQGTDTMKDGKIQTSEGTWTFTEGTGKLKGIRGKGTYKGKPDDKGNVVYEVEGEYEMPAKK